MGKKRTPEQRKAHSECMKEVWADGRRKPAHTEESRQKQSESLKAAYASGKRVAWQKGKPSPFKGKHHTAESNEKNSRANRGRPAGNKGKKGAQVAWNKGKPWSEETKQRMSEGSLGCGHTEETKKKISERMKIVQGEPQVRRRVRTQALRRIEQSLAEDGQICPAYNRQACEFFRRFDEANDTDGQYATNGGEYRVEGLGYFLDYINHDLKLIIEWDEEAHYRNGKLRQKDVRRQKEIQEQFPGYTFIRIREKQHVPDALALLREIG